MVMLDSTANTNYSPNDIEQDMFDIVTTLFEIKTVSLKKELEKALFGYLKTMDSKVFANTIILLGGREKEIQYLTELYKTALTTPTQTPRRGFLMSG